MLCDRSVQCASECHTPVPVSTLKPRVCLCGRVEFATTCKSHQAHSMLTVTSLKGCDLVEAINKHVSFFTGIKGHIKCSRMCVFERFVKQHFSEKLRVSSTMCTVMKLFPAKQISCTYISQQPEEQTDINKGWFSLTKINVMMFLCGKLGLQPTNTAGNHMMSI